MHCLYCGHPMQGKVDRLLTSTRHGALAACLYSICLHHRRFLPFSVWWPAGESVHIMVLASL